MGRLRALPDHTWRTVHHPVGAFAKEDPTSSGRGQVRVPEGPFIWPRQITGDFINGIDPKQTLAA